MSETTKPAEAIEVQDENEEELKKQAQELLLRAEKVGKAKTDAQKGKEGPKIEKAIENILETLKKLNYFDYMNNSFEEQSNKLNLIAGGIGEVKSGGTDANTALTKIDKALSEPASKSNNIMDSVLNVLPLALGVFNLVLLIAVSWHIGAL